MSKEQLTDFDRNYLATWTEPDPKRRRAVIDGLWSPGGRMSVSSLGVTLTGIEEIAGHIARVHDDLIAAKGLVFSYDQRVESGEAVLLRWSMNTPAGQPVGRGVDVLSFTDDGLIDSVHMFMGVD